MNDLIDQTLADLTKPFKKVDFEPKAIDIVTILGDMRRWMLKATPVPTYEEILATWGREFRMWRLDMLTEGSWVRTKPNRNIQLMQIRDRWIAEFGFAIPCAELLDACAKHAPILEIGAGTGFMTTLMRHRGIDVVGSDPDIACHWFDAGKLDSHQWRLQGKTAIRRRVHRKRTVFCSWPSYEQTWFRQALKAMRIGQRIIIVLEDACADDSAWDYLQTHFKFEQGIDVPAWPMLNDRAEVWIKKANRCTNSQSSFAT